VSAAERDVNVEPQAAVGAAPNSFDAELHRVADGSMRRMSGENFPVALRFLPRRVRDDLTRVYLFARFVDNVGDEADGDRKAMLEALADDVRALPAGEARLDPVRGLAPLIRDHGLGTAPLLDLVEANRRDQFITSYQNFDDLLEYCRFSAAPIGRMVLVIAGVSDPVAIGRSDTVCNALQVLEHCQDVREDAVAGRVYLPAADLRAAGVALNDLTARTTSPALRTVVQLQVDRAEAMLAEARPLTRSLRGWARLAVTGYAAGGLATVAALRGGDYDVLARHLAPGKASTLRYAARLAVAR
jgi:squalene synthase HpnC